MTLQWQRQLREAEKDCERMKVRTGEVGAKGKIELIVHSVLDNGS